MLSKASFELVANLTNFGFKLNILPFYWDKNPRILHFNCTRSIGRTGIRQFRISALIFNLISILVLGNTVASGLRLVFENHESPNKLIFHAAIFLWFALSSCIQLNNVMHGQGICQLTTHYFLYDVKLTGKGSNY